MMNYYTTYSAAERFIFSREFFGMKLGLENIQDFLATLGNPQSKYKTVHIGGTNGKGSTSAMLASICRSAGYKTGLYTSPHLVNFRERIQIDGKYIPAQTVLAFVNRHRAQLVKKKSPSLN
ncbi:MAG: hypothetical protein SGI97_07090 [candidate division Zixibacteria bacterium]|mgnify:CR=1 FL=1|nr:hypothetical protein [candidate division Zixibacteria bacterium]